MKHIKIFLTAVVVFMLLLGALGFEKEYTQTEFMMDTVITITAYGKNAKQATAIAMERIAEIDKKFNCHSQESEIYRINSQRKTTDIDPEVYALIKRAIEFSKATDGAFDITLKPLSDLWQIGTGNEKVPSNAEIEKALQSIGAEHISLCDDDKSIEFLKDNMALDLGGVAKGYAASEATEVLKQEGIENAYLDLGGNISVIGKKPLNLFESIKKGQKSRDFVIGIQDPGGSRGEIIDTVVGDENYIVTSGAYERNFEENGKIYHHIFDGKTGYPAEIKHESVTVVSKDAIAADMISTAVFVLSKDGLDKIDAGLYDEIIFADKGKTEHIKSKKN